MAVSPPPTITPEAKYVADGATARPRPRGSMSIALLPHEVVDKGGYSLSKVGYRRVTAGRVLTKGEAGDHYIVTTYEADADGVRQRETKVVNLGRGTKDVHAVVDGKFNIDAAFKALAQPSAFGSTGQGAGLSGQGFTPASASSQAGGVDVKKVLRGVLGGGLVITTPGSEETVVNPGFAGDIGGERTRGDSDWTGGIGGSGGGWFVGGFDFGSLFG